MDVRNHTTPSNCGFDECVKFLVSSNGKLQMTRRDSLHFEILASVSGQFKNLSR